MSLKLIISYTDPSIEALVSAEVARAGGKVDVEVSWAAKEPGYVELLDKEGRQIQVYSSSCIAYYVACNFDPGLYGGSALEKAEVDRWKSIGSALFPPAAGALAYLDRILVTKTWLVTERFTVADICVFSALYYQPFWDKIEKYPNVSRWYKQTLSLPAVQTVLELVRKNGGTFSKKTKKVEKSAKGDTRKKEAKLMKLSEAEMGKVVMRIASKADGFLHIGDTKLALLNQCYVEKYRGQLIIRFEDSNPAKESTDFEQTILEDLEMLQIKPDRFTHLSAYFDVMLEYCEVMLKEGWAYVDDIPTLPLKKNLELWEEMKNGTPKGQECCVKSKISIGLGRAYMQDLTIYQCKPEPHPRTGTKYKVYPTYDFACPIADAVEGVTHILRTREYLGRNDTFYSWYWDPLHLRRPGIWEYPRLNMTNTVLSKRKLTWFVAEGLVDGWDDPRFPTVRGILRRGITVEGLKQFIISHSTQRFEATMEWDQLWAFNRKVIGSIATRYTALSRSETVPVYVEGVTDGYFTSPNHPKDPAKGTKQVRVGPKLLIEKVDAVTLVEGENATFVNWGNLLIKKVKKKGDTVIEVHASLNLDNKDYKKTGKLNWLAVTENGDKIAKSDLIPCYAVFFDHIISKPVLTKYDDFKNFIAKDTRWEEELLGQTELARVNKDEIIQLQKKGFFRCDQPYAPASTCSSREQPLILFHIPDGRAPRSAATSTTVNATATPMKAPKEVKGKGESIEDRSGKAAAQGEQVQQLNSAKVDMALFDQEVETLLALEV